MTQRIPCPYMRPLALLLSRLSIMLAVVTCIDAGKGSAQAVPTATGPGSYIAIGTGIAAVQSDYGKQHLAGIAIYADVQPTWRYGVELELRRLQMHSRDQLRQSTYLLGPRITMRGSGLSPYVKCLVGVGHLDFPYGYAQGNYLALAPGVGLEYSLADRVYLRFVDIEYQHWPYFTFGSISPIGVSSGIAFRLNALKRYPGRGHLR